MKKFYQIIFACLMGFVLSVSSAQAANKARIAVMDFDNKTPYGGWRVGQGASDMLATALVKKTKFTVIERDKLASIVNEQNLSNNPDRFEPSTAAAIGKLLGAEYVVTGAVTEYGLSKAGGSGLGVSVKKKSYNAAVDIRVIDVNTGEIVFADDASVTKSSFDVKAFGMGAGEEFDEKKASEAMRSAIKKITKKLKKAKFKPRHIIEKTPEGPILVADVEGKIVTLNKGSNAGLEVGQKLTIKRKDKEIKDPDTGAVIKIKYKKVGKIKLTAVEAGYAEGEIISGDGIAVKDLAK